MKQEGTNGAGELLRPVAGERANIATHATGLALSFPAVWLLVKHAGTTAGGWSCAVYGAALIAVYAASTRLHCARRNRDRLEVLDHAAIYLLIAGTFTPFLVRVGGRLGAILLAVGWAMAAAGVLFKLLCGLKYPSISIASYLLLGWFPVVALRPILHSTSAAAVQWLVIGGLAYTLGVPFFLASQRRLRLHAIWHSMVMLGSAAHYIAVWLATGVRD